MVGILKEQERGVGTKAVPADIVNAGVSAFF